MPPYSFIVIAQNLVDLIFLVLWTWVSFFAYVLTYSLGLVAVSKLGKIDGAYDSKAKVLLPNFETAWQGFLFEGHNKKRHPCPSLNY